MKYLCLGFIEEKKFQALPPGEVDQIVADAYAWVDDLRKRGHLVSSIRLQPSHSATTLRIRNGRLSLTDGPYAETREQLGGFSVIEARDLNEAIQLASQANALRFGCIEVRPIEESLP